MFSTSQHNALTIGLTQMGLTVSLEQRAQLIAYLKFLQKWNKTYNLTSITQFEKMIAYHLLDSLSVSPYLTGENIADVGSGAGLPGIPLSIYFPRKHFTLIESVGKKTRFMSHVVRELKLPNVRVVNARAEDTQEYQMKNAFDTMIARAVASVAVLIDISKHLLKRDGVLLMMKAHVTPEDSRMLQQYHTRTESLVVLGVDANRSLIIVRNVV